MTEETFIKGITILKEAFQNRNLNAKVYFESLKDLTDDQFLNAIVKIVQTTSKLYPDDNLISIIRETVYGPIEDKAVLAWTEARQAIISIGMYQSVSFADPIINGVIEAMGGWEKFCSMLIEEEPFRQKDFVNLYEALSRSGRVCPVKLIGYHERLNGFSEKTVLIGQEKRKEITAEIAAGKGVI